MAPTLRSRAVVGLQQAPEQLLALDLADRAVRRRWNDFTSVEAGRDSIADPLVRPMGVVEAPKGPHDAAQAPDAKENEVVQTLLTGASDPPFCVGIRIRGVVWGFHGFRARAPEHRVEVGTQGLVALMENEPRPDAHFVAQHQRIPGLLRHPGAVRGEGRLGEHDRAAFQMHDNQHEGTPQTAERPDLLGEQIGTEDATISWV